MNSKLVKVYIKYKWLVLFSTLLLVIIFNFISLLKVPPIWSDEALIYDIALNTLKENRNGTDLLKGTLIGSYQFGFGYPPLFFYSIALWFRLLGFSIYTMRLFSLMLGFIFLPVYIKVCKSLLNSTDRKLLLPVEIAMYGVILLLFSDMSLIKAIHIGRPEIQVILLGFLSVFFYLKGDESQKKDSNRIIIYYLLSGFILSLAFLTHFLAIIFIGSILLHIVVSGKENIYRRKWFYVFLSSFLIPIFVWMVMSYPNIQYLKGILLLRIIYKFNAPYWLWLVFSSQSIPTKITYILYFVIFWEFVNVVLYKKERKAVFILFLLLFSWIFTYLWQTEYSFVFVAVCTYLAFFYLIYFALVSKDISVSSRLKTYIVLFILMFIMNLSNSINLLASFREEGFSYKKYTNEILKVIPDNKSLYLSAIPDPFFGFKTIRGNTLYEFPILPTKTVKEDLVKILDKSDYIIFNQSLEAVVAGNIVLPYIQDNAKSIKKIGGLNQYQAIVVELKPRNFRIHR